MAHMLSLSAAAKRPVANWQTDAAALRAIAQMAVNVELFTIPLYMTSLYSIQGFHPITGGGTDFYQGRLWAGAKTSADPKTTNDKAFNIVFSVFIQEMLHLQMAANMATVVGVSPTFTGAPLQDENGGWLCYGPDKSVIPGIIDLKDTKAHEDVAVNIGVLDETALRLFLAIEQPEADARANIKEAKRKDYFPKVPFDKWQAGDALPLFGTIGWMYQCYFDYLNLKYDDGSTLWSKVFNPKAVQNDLFNTSGSGGHPMREFMGFETTIALTYPDIAFEQMVQMMDAITDQGEGNTINRGGGLLMKAVEPKYQPNDAALKSDYPSYSDSGKLLPSADAEARWSNDGRDHYERFNELQGMLHDLVTWPQWLKRNPTWTAEMLTGEGLDPTNPYKLPTPADVAGALNALAADKKNSQPLLSQAVVGAIHGVTSVLNGYWAVPAPGETAPLFPFPSMSGSGDRMSTAWAILGEAPDLSMSLPPPAGDVLYHSCQGIDFNGDGTNSCAQVEVFHSCRGSNLCRATGGCGFVQPTTGGGNCSSAVATRAPAAASCSANGCGSGGGGSNGGGGDSTVYSAPGDNKCGGFGGCAVPISASQVFPKAGTMQLFNFVNEPGVGWKSKAIIGPTSELQFSVGEKVHTVAWRAFSAVMTARGQTPPANPPADDNIRLAFPPST
ncbi:ferritin-like domain-containing protein [Caulobacter sp. NIBR1757]|uniref:ferritin-like domain-containing protein n=1 Tax=Caulobacter sp. NIBR1757 TaxID=3016000 RepID=UPI0022F059C4|nr:ferritin-like domain-containing protein [Caulobacter sp. NIBR1757]WGM37118.1 hypothetical protein AMEJIAPC_00012 [Caulobacter sp. NIBR1757]